MPGESLQQSHMTRPNRFPKIFESAKQIQPEAKRILSFGCSTGEECFSLAETFPNSEIVGIDVDYHSVTAARRNNKFKDRVFFHTDLGATGKYDLVLCLMVLFAMDKPIAFDKFEETLQLLDARVNPNGLLMLYTTEYDPMCVDCMRKKYVGVREWVRTHNKNNQEYFNGYYRKRHDVV